MAEIVCTGNSTFATALASELETDGAVDVEDVGPVVTRIGAGAIVREMAPTAAAPVTSVARTPKLKVP